MPKIKILPESVVSRIAAGEVIERPSYVIKELIENSIDALSTQIDVEIEDSGLALIRVVDNGIGMSKEDLLLSIKPHATSKIHKLEDLTNIKTLGFRGEALTSIANVSNLSIESKREKDKFGHRLVKICEDINIEPIALKEGTKVDVRQLFDNVPTRKKFLSSKKTELKHIIDTFIDFVLGTQNIGFTLRSDSKLIYEILKKQTIEEKIENVFGQEILQNLLHINYKGSYLSIEGFLAHPQISFTTTNKIFTYLNNRRIYNSLINSAIKEGYENLLEHTMYPMAILKINIHTELVDVNIHPRKEDVRFRIPEQIYSETLKAILNTLSKNNLTFGNISWKKSVVNSYAGAILKNELHENSTSESNEILQIKKIYLVKETQSGVAFFDQHAVHEAILFKKLKKSFLEKISPKNALELESPILLKLPKGEIEIFWDNKEIFNKIGYKIEEFGNNYPILTHVPKILHDRNHLEIIREIIEKLIQSKQVSKIDSKSYKMLSYIACKSAIKAGQTLSSDERLNLINQLEEEDFLYTCPHGRPVKIEITLNQLNRFFKRK
ncbi:MAG: DNA mismatch repair endonuclease MutL [Patescibacteria group bacterium]|nr:DNA mismatch repair endonuclease MutL [Patescibacteria group bacterium]